MWNNLPFNISRTGNPQTYIDNWGNNVTINFSLRDWIDVRTDP